MTKFKLIAYEKENGEVPVEEFLDSINPKMRAKIFGLLGILQEKGNMLSILVMESLNCVVNLEVISREFYIFFIMRKKLY